MKKLFFTLCFVVSASFAMANTIENKEETTTSKTETVVSPQAACTATVTATAANGQSYVVATVTVDCGNCTTKEACQKANAAIAVLLAD